jgi:arylsulfatase A-like enzyme
MYEESLRMPFLVRYPEKIAPGSVNNDIIANIDFAPTLLEVAGIKIPKEVQGKSFFSNLRGETPSDWVQSMYYHYYEFPFWHHVYPHYGIRTQKYKLIHFYYQMDEWEFYDLEKDPEELNNAINDTTYVQIIRQMKKELAELVVKSGNQKTIAEWCEITDKDFGNVESK